MLTDDFLGHLETIDSAAVAHQPQEEILIERAGMVGRRAINLAGPQPYENGTLKLPRQLPLTEGQKITITIHPPAEGLVQRAIWPS